MTHEEFQQKLERIPTSDLINMGEDSLSKLCKTGAKSFTMSVPPRIEDTDMIFSEVLNRLKKYEEHSKKILKLIMS